MSLICFKSFKFSTAKFILPFKFLLLRISDLRRFINIELFLKYFFISSSRKVKLDERKNGFIFISPSNLLLIVLKIKLLFSIP